MSNITFIGNAVFVIFVILGIIFGIAIMLAYFVLVFTTGVAVLFLPLFILVDILVTVVIAFAGVYVRSMLLCYVDMVANTRYLAICKAQEIAKQAEAENKTEGESSKEPVTQE